MFEGTRPGTDRHGEAEVSNERLCQTVKEKVSTGFRRSARYRKQNKGLCSFAYARRDQGTAKQEDVMGNGSEAGK